MRRTLFFIALAIVCGAIALLFVAGSRDPRALSNQTEGEAKIDELTKHYLSIGQDGDDRDVIRGVGADPDLRSVSLQQCGNLTDAAMTPIGRLDSLRSLNIGLTRIGDTGIECLREKTSLTKLTIWDNPLTDRGMVAIGTLTGLESLDLEGTKITSAGAAHLVRLKKLKYLDLNRTKIDDKALAAIGQLPLLETLALSDTAITAVGLKHLAGLSELTFLELNSNAISGPGLQALAKLPKLKILMLERTDVTDRDMEALGKIAALKELHLAYTKLTDAAIAHFMELKLELLMVNNTKVTRDGLKAFHKRRPDTRVDLLLSP